MAHLNALQLPTRPTCPSATDTWRASTPLCPTCPSAPDTWRTSTPFNSLHAPHVPQPRTHGAPQRPYAPHVPLPRTHGAPQRPECPTCPSNPDTWRTSTHFNSLHAPHVPQSRTNGAIHYGTGTYQYFSRIFTTSVYPKPRILAIWGTSALNRYFTSEISLSISSPVNEDSASLWNSVLHMSGREAKMV